MKAFGIKTYGKQPLDLLDVPKPFVGPHDVLVEIHAASVNPLDFKIRNGLLKIIRKYEMPLVMGNDCSGIITELGSEVHRFKVGDEIYARAQKERIGTFAEYIAIHEDAVALKPVNLSFEEAASIPLVGLTSYQVLHDTMKLQKDDKVLIHAGSGGVGTFAIQLAKSMGALVATTVSDAGVELATSLGADTIINYKTEQFETLLKDYDFVFDTLGGNSLEKSFSVLKPGGKIVSVGGLPNGRFGRENNMGFLKTLIFSLITRKITKLEKAHGIPYIYLFMAPSGAQLEILAGLIEEEKIKPVVDRVFSFDETPSALSYVETGRAKGKVVVKIKD